MVVCEMLASPFGALFLVELNVGAEFMRRKVRLVATCKICWTLDVGIFELKQGSNMSRISLALVTLSSSVLTCAVIQWIRSHSCMLSLP